MLLTYFMITFRVLGGGMSNYRKYINGCFQAGVLSFCVPGVGHAAWNWTLLSNPYWEIEITDAGYSDYLFDNTPGFEGREYLSGEWGAAIAYSKNSSSVSPIWMEPMFSFPDWETNSNFTTTQSTTYIDDPAGLVAKSTIANADLKIEQVFGMFDTITGTPMGLSPASNGGVGDFLMSNRYVLFQEYNVTNTGSEAIDNVQVFQLLHGLNSQTAVYDDRFYAGAYGDFQYDVTLSGVDPYSGGGQVDYIGFSSTEAPSAHELGYFGLFDVDDHDLGKPSTGTHLSVEANSLSDNDEFAPTDGWVAGAQRWDMGTLAAGETKSLGVMLSLLTGWSVDAGDRSGSGNGGSSVPGGVDYEFSGDHSDGQFFFEYSLEDEYSLAQLIRAGEFGDLTFSPAGSQLQLFDVDFDGDFSGLLKLTFGYDGSLFDLDSSLLRVFHWNDDLGQWENLGGEVDAMNHTITVYTSNLSPFALAAVPLPGSAWLFGSVLFGLIGIKRRSR